MHAALGMSAQTNSLADAAAHARSIFVIGSDTTEQHPIFGVSLRKAVLKRGCKVVVAHPDFINMAEYSALRLVHRPGAEEDLINGLMHIILQEGWQDVEFIEKSTTGFDELKASLIAYDPESVAAATGVMPEALREAAEILSHNRPMAIVWSTGVMDPVHPAQSVQALVNLQLLLGNLGIPGGGLFPLRSQSNSQGGADMGAHPDFYPGYQPAASDGTRRKFEAIWGKGLPTRPGMTAMEMTRAAAEGRLRALYVLCGDIISGAADARQVRHGLHNCDFLVVQGVFESEATRSADVLLPGVTFAEKTGTFTNTERRIQMVHQAIRPLGEARPDWQIIAALAGHIRGAGPEPDEWDYADTTQIMAEIASLTPIYAGVSQERLEKLGSLQWPVKNLSHAGTSMLGPESFGGGRGKFIPARVKEMA
jgi:predicted molibdopterin-dependent oxidoreductase YjgC